MKISPLGAFVVSIGVIVAIAIWVVAYFGLPNYDTHRMLAKNAPVLSSATSTNGTGSPTGTSSGQATATSIVAADPTTKTVSLNIQSTDMNINSGLNFNGFANGKMVITVPVGWTVKVTYTNKQSMSHSIGFTSYADRTSAGSFTPAFSGSIGPKFISGIGSSDAPITYSFTASKAGQYAMVCGIPGHAAGGMWDEFDVSKSAAAPSVKTS